MPNIIIGNVDNENMVGDITKLTIEQQCDSSKVANRLLWLMKAGDIIVLPRPISKEYLSYVCQLLNIDIKSIQIIIPNLNKGGQAQLTFDVLRNHELINDIKRAMVGRQNWKIIPYYYDRSVAWLTEALCIETNCDENSFFMQAGAEQFNSKADFRRLAIGNGIPIAEGSICYSKQELYFAVRKNIDITGTVILKQNRQAGGDGNSVITKNKINIPIGASAVYQMIDSSDLNRLLDELWVQKTDSHNSCIVVEAYYINKKVYYTELAIAQAFAKPCLLNFGEMRMAPLWYGFKIPGNSLNEIQLAHLIHGSTQLVNAVAQTGYVGKVNCDAVLTDDNKIFFTEINGRLGGCTHIDVLARNLLGDDYMNNFVLLSGNQLPCQNFNLLIDAMHNARLHFSQDKHSGIILLVDDSHQKKKVEYLIISDNLSNAHLMEDSLFALNIS